MINCMILFIFFRVYAFISFKGFAKITKVVKAAVKGGLCYILLVFGYFVASVFNA